MKLEADEVLQLKWLARDRVLVELLDVRNNVEDLRTGVRRVRGHGVRGACVSGARERKGRRVGTGGNFIGIRRTSKT